MVLWPSTEGGYNNYNRGSSGNRGSYDNYNRGSSGNRGSYGNFSSRNFNGGRSSGVAITLGALGLYNGFGFGGGGFGPSFGVGPGFGYNYAPRYGSGYGSGYGAGFGSGFDPGYGSGYGAGYGSGAGYYGGYDNFAPAYVAPSAPDYSPQIVQRASPVIDNSQTVTNDFYREGGSVDPLAPTAEGVRRACTRG